MNARAERKWFRIVGKTLRGIRAASNELHAAASPPCSLLRMGAAERRFAGLREKLERHGSPTTLLDPAHQLLLDALGSYARAAELAQRGMRGEDAAIAAAEDALELANDQLERCSGAAEALLERPLRDTNGRS